MKVTKETPKAAVIEIDYTGLATDRDDDVWILTEDHCVCFSEYPFSICRSDIDDYGPFTPYHGQVVLEN